MLSQQVETPIIRFVEENPPKLVVQIDETTVIIVDIPSISRAECYGPELARSLADLYRQLPTTTSVTSAFTAAAAAAVTSSAPSLLPTDSVSMISMDKQRVLTECANYLVSIFDQQLMIYQNRDIDVYRDSISLSLKTLYGLSIDETHRLFDQYLKSRSGNAESYERYMHSTYPHINTLLHRVSTNFCNSTFQALQRIQRDLPLLQVDLLRTLGEHITLSNIHLTKSDPHKQGQQVIILEFTNNSNEQKLVVYKPSPVLADAFLVGDMDRLATLDNYFEGCASLVSIFNNHLIQTAKHSPLPTYLIIPRVEGNPDKIKSHYGYIEYVTHEPWQEINYARALQVSLENLPSRMRDSDNSAQDAVKLHFIRFLSNAARHKDCDFIARTPEEVNQYSRDCGLLLALLVCTGGTDLHCENMIMHGRRPMLIDLEACFTRSGLTPISTACFDEYIGAIMRASANHETVRCLFDICGIEQKTIVHLEKNRMFHLFAQVGNQLIACQPDRTILLEGYELGLNIIAANKHHVLNWLQNVERFNVPIRVVPYSTKEFRGELRQVYEDNFSEESFIENRSAKLEMAPQEYENMVKTFQEIDPHSRLFSEMPLPVYAIYLNRDPCTSIYSEYLELNIPYYYTRVNDRRLHDFHDQVINIPLHALTPSQISGEQPISEITGNFFPNSSFEFIRNRLIEIIDTPELRQAMLKRAAKDSQCLTRHVDDSIALTVVNVEDASLHHEPVPGSRPWVKQPANAQPHPKNPVATESEPLIPRKNRKDDNDGDDSDRCRCRLM